MKITEYEDIVPESLSIINYLSRFIPVRGIFLNLTISAHLMDTSIFKNDNIMETSNNLNSSLFVNNLIDKSRLKHLKMSFSDIIAPLTGYEYYSIVSLHTKDHYIYSIVYDRP